MPLQFDSDNVLLLVFVAALAAAVPLLGPIAFGDLGGEPAPAWNWIAFAIATPTLVLFLLHDPEKPLTNRWRAFWTLAFLAFLIQLWSSSDPTLLSPAAQPPRLFGSHASNILLAVLWAGSVGVAWAMPKLIWPHAIMFILLSTSALVTPVWCDPGSPRTFGLLFLLGLVGAAAIRVSCLKAEIGKLPAGRAAEPVAPSITAALLLRQVWRDANGKEVQIAATYSYLWLADQFGHVGLGLMLCLIATKIAAVVAHVASASGTEQWVGFLVTAVGVCLWEYRAYHDATAPLPVPGPFEADEPMIRRNAVVAALYMVIGAGMGWAFEQQETRTQLAALAALLFVAIVSAKYWVRQKIIWQKAGLPYLFRLSDAQHTIYEKAAEDLTAMIEAVAPPEAKPQQVVIAGPLGSGRTKLAAGVGTEFAFRDKTVRYVSLDRLLEFADAQRVASNPARFADDLGPNNIGYWPWTRAQVLIIDDIGPVLDSLHEKDLVDLLDRKLGPLQVCLRDRHTIWILGDLGSDDDGRDRLARFTAHIHCFCKGEREPTSVLLHAPGQTPDVQAPALGSQEFQSPKLAEAVEP